MDLKKDLCGIYNDKGGYLFWRVLAVRMSWELHITLNVITICLNATINELIQVNGWYYSILKITIVDDSKEISTENSTPKTFLMCLKTIFKDIAGKGYNIYILQYIRLVLLKLKWSSVFTIICRLILTSYGSICCQMLLELK